MSSHKPEFAISDGSLRLAIWRFTKRRDDGSDFVTHSTKIDKRYFDRTTNEWKETGFLSKQDVASLQQLLPKAYDWMRQDIEDQRAERRSDREEQEEEY